MSPAAHSRSEPRSARTLPRATLVLAALVAATSAESQPLVDRQIPVGGTTLRLRCGGTRAAGTPLVSFEAGAFNTAVTWSAVQPEVARFARTCAHDRPNRGASGAAPAGLDARGYVRLLAEALRAAGEPPPYVLVGHSMGGLIAQLFAVDRPGDVVGIVLVDSSHPGQVPRMARLPRGSSLTPGAPPPVERPEAVEFAAFAAALGPSPPRLTIPVAVLSRSRWTNATDGPDDLARLAVWRELQGELAAMSARAWQVTAPNAGHYVQTDAPGLVVDAVRRLVERR